MASTATAQLDIHRHLALLNAPTFNAAPTNSTSRMSSPERTTNFWGDSLGLTAEQAYSRRREWNRGPLTDLFPRIPSASLEDILDICISKGFTYNLSESRLWNARRYTAITVAHVRHQHSEYDSLLKDGVERFEARQQSGAKVWKVLKDWCPWESSNEVLRKCFEATLLPLEQREQEWAFVDDPMDIDSESDLGGDGSVDGVGRAHDDGFADDPMDLD